jgi:putative addiction module killer protein
MIEVVKSETFHRWFRRLRDRRAAMRIAARIDRLALGNPGDVEPIGNGLSELRIDCGTGYRVYYQQQGKVLILILCAGTKQTQQRDIAKAKRLAEGWNK